MNYFPAMLNIDYKTVVIVGGGHVARQKLEALLPTKATIIIVSPNINEQLAAYIKAGHAKWKQKAFDPSDLDDASLIFAVTNDHAVNDEVEQAAQHWQLLSRADAQGRVDFINPAVVRRGDFVLTVSTSGASPTLTRKVKNELAEQYDEAYSTYVAFLKQARAQLLEIEEQLKRKQALQLLAADQLLEWVRQGDLEKCQQYVNQLVGEQKS